MTSAEVIRRVSGWLLAVAAALNGAAYLFLLQPTRTVDMTLAQVSVMLFYVAWLLLLASVVYGLMAWFRGSRSWWTVVGLVYFVGLTWIVGCAIPAANLS